MVEKSENRKNILLLKGKIGLNHNINRKLATETMFLNAEFVFCQQRC